MGGFMERHEAVIEALRLRLPADRIVLSAREVSAASSDQSDLRPVRPLCVVRPRHVDEVQRLVQVAIEFRIPLTPRGAGTGLEGACIPSPGAVVVDFTAMDDVHEVLPEERRVTVGPGIVYQHLNRLLSAHGLFFPPSPGGSADAATIGGMVSTDASGIYALRYGGTRPWVLALEAVTGTGEVLRLGRAVPKTSSGYDLKDLFVGSEGTLGLITRVTLRLAPLPLDRRQAGFAFERIEHACAAASWMAAFIPELAAVELCDADTIALLRSRRGHGSLPAGHCLLVEVHGRAQDCEDGIRSAIEVARDHGGTPLPADLRDPLDLRHWTTRRIRESAEPLGVMRTDCAVPLTHLARFVADAKRLAQEHARTLYVFGHVGLGIVHALMPLAGPGAWTMEQALAEKRRLALEAVSLGGTVSGEHGIGLGNRDLLAAEHPGALPYMRGLKTLFDPHGVLNPDKVLPTDL